MTEKLPTALAFHWEENKQSVIEIHSVRNLPMTKEEYCTTTCGRTIPAVFIDWVRTEILDGKWCEECRSGK